MGYFVYSTLWIIQFFTIFWRKWDSLCIRTSRFTVCNMTNLLYSTWKALLYVTWNIYWNMKDLLYATWKIYCMQHEKFTVFNMKGFNVWNMKNLLSATWKDLLLNINWTWLPCLSDQKRIFFDVFPTGNLKNVSKIVNC